MFFILLLPLIIAPPAIAQVGNEKNKRVINSAAKNSATPAQVIEPSKNYSGSDGYRNQSKEYEQLVIDQPKNASAWENYYKAERYSNYTKTSNDIPENRQKILDNIVMQMEKNIPGTFEYHYIKYLNGNHDVNLFPHLEKAYKLNPANSELYNQFIAYYEITGNTNKKTEFCKKLNDSKNIPASIMEFAHNILQSIEKNAILITHGEYDTYPVWIWQHVKNTRNDITILYIDLLEKENYRKAKLSELGININPSIASGKEVLLKELASKSTRPVYFANTVAPEILKPIKQNLYLTGLAFKYSDAPVENINMLVDTWEQKFSKQWLKKVPVNYNEAQLYNNYLPMMILLKEHYEKINQPDKAQEINNTAIKIAAAGGKEHQLKLLLNKK